MVMMVSLWKGQDCINFQRICFIWTGSVLMMFNSEFRLYYIMVQFWARLSIEVPAIFKIPKYKCLQINLTSDMLTYKNRIGIDCQLIFDNSDRSVIQLGIKNLGLILKIMDKNYTPQKQPKTTVRQTAQSYSRNTPEPGPRIAPATQLAILKDYESLKIQVRQLETKNRSLTNEIEQLLYEKTYNQNKYIQKMNFEEEAITQFHKQKNYQLELLQIKHEQENSKLKRESELRADEYLREIKHKDYQLKEKDEQNRYLEMRNEELRRDYETLNLEFAKCRQQNSIASEKLTHNDFTIKKLQMHLEELELVKAEMESQIRTLLDIEAEKSITLNNLEIQLRNSEDNERRLVEKLTILGENFAELEDHISVMKQKLLHADESNHLLTQKLNNSEIQNRERQRQILEQNERESHLRLELEQHQKRQSRREREVSQLMAQNERLYKQLNINRHRLHEFGIAYGVDI